MVQAALGDVANASWWLTHLNAMGSAECTHLDFVPYAEGDACYEHDDNIGGDETAHVPYSILKQAWSEPLIVYPKHHYEGEGHDAPDEVVTQREVLMRTLKHHGQEQHYECGVYDKTLIHNVWLL